MTISVSYKFDDAAVLITGAGSGIGAALARHCAREGASVIAIDRAHDNLLGYLEPALRNEAEKFRKLRIRIEPPVQYTDVIRAMSAGRINIFTQRPFLAHARHLTLRYFEEFCADTIPLLMLDRSLAEAVYGPAARELTLKGRAAEKILDALRRPDHYRGVVEGLIVVLVVVYAPEGIVGLVRRIVGLVSGRRMRPVETPFADDAPTAMPDLQHAQPEAIER